MSIDPLEGLPAFKPPSVPDVVDPSTPEAQADEAAKALRDHYLHTFSDPEVIREHPGMKNLMNRAKIGRGVKQLGWTAERIAKEGDPPFHVMLDAMNHAAEGTVPSAPRAVMTPKINKTVPVFGQ